MQVGIYTRISNDDSAELKRRGVEHQAQDCRAFAERRGWQVVDIYEDNSISASSKANLARPEYDRLLIDLASGRIERILVLGQDRLLRRPEQLETLFRIHQNLGIPTIECVSGPPIDMLTSTGRIHARMKAVFDAAYAEYVSEKLTQYKRDLAERGLPRQGGRRPFGYTTDGLEIVDYEADLIVEAINGIFTEQRSLGAIAREWNTRGIRTTKGNLWRPGVVRAVLCRVRNAGLREYRGNIIGPAAWPAIISIETRTALLAALDARARRKGRVVKRRLLTGLLVCSKCGRQLNCGGSSRGTRGEYRCGNEWGRQGCGGTSIRALAVELHIVHAALDELERRGFEDDSTARDLQHEVTGLQGRLSELACAHFVDGAITQSEWHGARDLIVARIADLEMRIKVRSNRLDAQGIRGSWHTLETAEMRSILDRVVDYVVVRPSTGMRHRVDLNRLEIHYREPDRTLPINRRT
jgi:site-specific DNA recombinase